MRLRQPQPPLDSQGSYVERVHAWWAEHEFLPWLPDARNQIDSIFGHNPVVTRDDGEKRTNEVSGAVHTRDLAIFDEVETFIALWNRRFIVKLRISTGPVVRWRIYSICFSLLF